MASPDLWPRWGRAVGIWAKRSQEARDRETDPRQSRCGMSWHVVEHWENIAGGIFCACAIFINGGMNNRLYIIIYNQYNLII